MNGLSVQDLLTLNVELGTLIRSSGKLKGKTAYWIGKIKRKCEAVSKDFWKHDIEFRKEYSTDKFDETKYSSDPKYVTPWKEGGEKMYDEKRQELLDTIEENCIPDFEISDFDFKNEMGEVVSAASPAIFLALSEVIKDPSQVEPPEKTILKKNKK